MNRHYMRRDHLDDDLESAPFERIRSKKNEYQVDEPHRRAKDFKHPEQAFKCASCGAMVSTARESSGVNNRNHCPLCLCSRHVDEFKAGDRLCRLPQPHAGGGADLQAQPAEIHPRRAGRADAHPSLRRLREDRHQPRRRG